MKDLKNSLVIRVGALAATAWMWFALSSCGDSEPPAPPQPEVMTKAVLMGIYSAETLQEFVPQSGIDIDPAKLLYDVELYLISYKTMFKGTEITASGLVALPGASEAVSMLSVHHGTITRHIDAPSASTTFSQQAAFCAAFSSLGFITVMPDLIGFGDSKDQLHPYYVEEPTVSAVVDNLKAAVELAGIKQVEFNKNLFLTGYSEGGFVTMAVHKHFDLNPSDEFNLQASFPAAGGYDVKMMQEYVFGLDTFEDPYYLAFLTYAYQTTYDWDQPLSDFFNEPYADNIPSLFNGTLSGGQINEELTTTIVDLLTTEIRLSIDSNPKYTSFVNALNNNSLTDWTPVTPMYMYHGDEDTTVPYGNSVAVYDQLIANGASPANLTFITLPGADHSTGLQPYIEDVVIKLLEINL